MKIKKYLRDLLESFPHAAAESTRLFGMRGFYLASCAFVLRAVPFSVRSIVCGPMNTAAEAINFIDNFCLGELRCERVERALAAMDSPWIVDVGINVGLSARWWLSQQPSAHVIGVDMFQEALDFATQRIESAGLPVGQWHSVAGAVGESEGQASITFASPLEGTNSLVSTNGGNSRLVQVDRLDRWLAPYSAHPVFLLKLDIEGAAGSALCGAAETLARTRFVVVETHHEAETQMASELLARAGFTQFRVHGRSMWWEASNGLKKG